MSRETFIQEYKDSLHKRCNEEELKLLSDLNRLSVKYYDSKLSDLCYIQNMNDEELEYLYFSITNGAFSAGNEEGKKAYFYNGMRLGTVVVNDKGQPVIQEQNNPFIPLISLLLEIKQDSNTNEIKKQSTENNNDKSEEALYSDKDVKVKTIHPSDEEWKRLMSNATAK